MDMGFKLHVCFMSSGHGKHSLASDAKGLWKVWISEVMATLLHQVVLVFFGQPLYEKSLKGPTHSFVAKWYILGLELFKTEYLGLTEQDFFSSV